MSAALRHDVPAVSSPRVTARRLVAPLAAAALLLGHAPALAAPAPDATLALAAFDAREGATPDEAALVADIVTATLVNDGKLRIVERAQLARVMKEQALALSGAMSDANQIKVAQLVGAHWLLVGTLQSHKRGFALSGRAIDSSSGQVAFADSVQIESKDQLTAGARQLAHQLQDKLVGGQTAATGVDDYDAPQVKEAARQLALQIAERFPKLEGKLAEVLPDNSAACVFPEPKAAFVGERFVVAGADSVSEQVVDKGYFLITELSEKGCAGRVKRSGGDEISNGDQLRSFPLKVSMPPLTVGAGTDPQVSQILSKETLESLKNQPGFEVGEGGTVALVGRIGGAKGRRVIEVQAVDAKSRAVLQRWDLTGLF